MDTAAARLVGATRPIKRSANGGPSQASPVSAGAQSRITVAFSGTSRLDAVVLRGASNSIGERSGCRLDGGQVTSRDDVPADVCDAEPPMARPTFVARRRSDRRPALAGARLR